MHHFRLSYAGRDLLRDAGMRGGQMQPANSFWTEERHNKCAEMWRTGKSASAIGAELGTTRNAVIGRMKRTGIPTGYVPIITSPQKIREAKARYRYRVRRENEAVRKRPKPLAVENGRVVNPTDVWVYDACEEQKPLLTSLVDLTSTSCRWVCEGTDDNCLPQFCGNFAHDGRWCGYHARIVYRVA